MYRDFNMVISPLYPAINGLFMSLLGNNFIVFSIINTIYVLLVLFFIYKISRKIYLFSIPFVLLTCLPNYNTLCILFALILIYLEKEKKNDYLIGLIIALAFLTKINAGVLLAIPTLYYFKDIKKILKRFAGFLIPNLIVIIIFLLTNNLKNYISYVFLGIFDFAKNNLIFEYMALIVPVILIYLIYLFIKEKNVIYLYGIFFLGLIYPIMNQLHVMIAILPALVLIFNRHESIIYRLRYTAFLFMLFPVVGLIVSTNGVKFGNDDNIFKYRRIEEKYIERSNVLKDYFKGDFSNVTFVLYDNYLYKLLLGLKIDKYDIILYGNMGYKGTEKMIEHLKNDKHKYYILDTTIEGAQFNNKISSYIRSNYKIETILNTFYIYKKEA